MLRWPLLWKRCHVSLVGGNRNNGEKVLACFSFCLDTTHCYQTSRLPFVLFCFISRDKNGPFLVNYAIQAATEKTHKRHVSTPWMDNFSLIRRHLVLTAGVHDLIVWTGRRLLTSDNNISKYSSALLGQIWLTVWSGKQTKSQQHWNLRMTSL